MALDEVTQAFVDSKFDESGEPVESGGADFGSFTDDDFLYDSDVPSGPRSESELASAYAAANNDEAAVGRVNELIDQENDRLVDELDSYLPDDGYDEQPAAGIPFPGSPQAPGETDEQFAYRVAQETLTQWLGNQALQQAQQPTAEQQLSAAIASATTESLAHLAAIEESKAARSAQYDAQAEAVYAEQVSQAEARAHELLDGALARNNAAGYPNRAEVLDVANQLMVDAGYTQEVISGMSDWQREQAAAQAIGEAAQMAGDASIAANVLGQYGWKGPRTR